MAAGWQARRPAPVGCPCGGVPGARKEEESGREEKESGRPSTSSWGNHSFVGRGRSAGCLRGLFEMSHTR